MDDYNIVSLQESNNEWVSRLINLLSPCLIQGVHDMFLEALKICNETNENEKYLMTFQNILSRVPKWSSEILDKEVDRIKEMSKCEYLEDLISCVHIVQLKALTCIRVGQKQKTINIDIPKFDAFVHKVYTHLARKLYSNVYLYETNIQPLTIQKNNREVEMIAKDCILEAIRESIPVEAILRAYLDKTIEENVEQEIVHENVELQDTNKGGQATSGATSEEPESESTVMVSTESMPIIKTNDVSSISIATDVNSASNSTNISADISADLNNTELINNDDSLLATSSFSSDQVSNTISDSVNTLPPPPSNTGTSIQFSDIDEVHNAETGKISTEVAPKDVVSLERRAEANFQKQMALEEDDDDDRIKIHNLSNENIVLDVETL